ncbi:VWA domain-containing protein [Candidatus Woesearchaeota archaeon]|nr:VWA domain-containing protein [Candidatus Woesearchaeota archaeon]
MARSIQQNYSQLEEAEEASGKLKMQNIDDKMMRSVLESDKDTIDKGKLVESAFDMGINSFSPDLMFEQVVNNFKLAEQIYGESILRELFGEEPDYIEKNVRIPEFQRQLKNSLKKNLKELSDDGIIDRKFNITEKGIELASLVMYTEELDNIIPKGFAGQRMHKKQSHYGGKEDVKDFRRGDRYKDIALRKSIKTAIRRGHKDIHDKDLKTFERQSRGQVNIIYALDSSGSMKGRKIGSCKKAGIALAYKAVSNKDKVGLIVFGEDIKSQVEPTMDFTRLLKEIVRIKASKKTDLVKTIERAVEIFPDNDATKHLILLTDAMPTAGEMPEKETLEAAGIAANADITISLVGINLNKKGEELARKIIEIGKGRLYSIKNLENMDKLVLEDYYSVA